MGFYREPDCQHRWRSTRGKTGGCVPGYRARELCFKEEPLANIETLASMTWWRPGYDFDDELALEKGKNALKRLANHPPAQVIPVSAQIFTTWKAGCSSTYHGTPWMVSDFSRANINWVLREDDV